MSAVLAVLDAFAPEWLRIWRGQTRFATHFSEPSFRKTRRIYKPDFVPRRSGSMAIHLGRVLPRAL